MRCLRGVSMGLFALLGAALVYADDESGWRRIYEEKGVVVSTLEEPGQDLPRFRGQATLSGDVLHMLAILLDDTRSKEWAKSADEAEVLRSIDMRTQIVYSRSHLTWPVKDRDLVMKRSVEILEPGKSFRVHLVCIPGEKAEIKGVIRIARCDTTIALRKIDAAHTYVDYRVRADPGGSSPSFMVKWASKNIPFDTLTALAKQVQRTRGQYASVVKTWQDAR